MRDRFFVGTIEGYIELREGDDGTLVSRNPTIAHDSPVGLSLNKKLGELYALLAGNLSGTPTIEKFDDTFTSVGDVLTSNPFPALTSRQPWDLAVLKDGTFYVLLAVRAGGVNTGIEIWHIEADGTVIDTWTADHDTPMQTADSGPMKMVVDCKGIIHYSDYGATIFRFDPSTGLNLSTYSELDVAEDAAYGALSLGQVGKFIVSKTNIGDTPEILGPALGVAIVSRNLLWADEYADPADVDGGQHIGQYRVDNGKRLLKVSMIADDDIAINVSLDPCSMVAFYSPCGGGLRFWISALN